MPWVCWRVRPRLRISAISAGQSSNRYCPGRDLILGSKSETGRSMSRVAVMQIAVVTSAGLTNAVGANDVATLGDTRTIADLSEIAIAAMRSGTAMRIGEHGLVATERQLRASRNKLSHVGQLLHLNVT